MNSISPQDINEYLNDLLSKKGLELADYDVPRYNLNYVPFWVFEYHIGKKKGTGFLNASNSEIILDNKEYCCAIKAERADLDKLLTLEEYKIYKPVIVDLRVSTNNKALDLLNYKLPYLLEEKDKHFITEVELIYLPIWEVGLKIDKDYKVSLSAVNKSALAGFDFLMGGIEDLRDQSNLALFSNMLSEIKNPLNFLKYLGYVFLYLSKLFFYAVSWFFEGRLVWLKLIILLALIVLIILLI